MTSIKSLLIAIIFTLLPMITFTTERQVDCEQLAQHIQLKMQDLDYPTVVKASDGTLNITYQTYCHWTQKTDKTTIPCLEYLDSSCAETLPDSLKVLEKYQSALKRCIKTSTTPTPLAQKTRVKLRQTTTLISQCLVRGQEHSETIRQQTAARDAQMKQQEKVAAALDDYIEKS